MQNAKPTLRSESRGQTCLRYAEPRGGKACEAGLMQNSKCKIKFTKVAKFCHIRDIIPIIYHFLRTITFCSDLFDTLTGEFFSKYATSRS